MPFLLAFIGIALRLAGAGTLLYAGLMWARQKQLQPNPEVGAVIRPPVGYHGDLAFAFPWAEWCSIECVARAGRGYVYGVRFGNGQAAVLRDHELAR